MKKVSTFLVAEVRLLVAKPHFLLVFLACIFIYSCNQNDEIVLQSFDAKSDNFNKEMFRIAMEKTSIKYIDYIKNRHFDDNFRTLMDSDVLIQNYINDVSEIISPPEFTYQAIPSYDWNNDNHTFAEELTFSEANLSFGLNRHIRTFENNVEDILLRYELGFIDDEQCKLALKNASEQESTSILNDFTLTPEEKELAGDIFLVASDMVDPVHLLLLEEGNPTNAFINGRLGRALGRILIGVVVTAIIVAVPVAAVAVAKAIATGVTLGTVKIGAATGIGKIVAASLTKGIAIGAKTKLSGALMTGLYAGFKNAGTNWDKEWKGLKDEVKYTVKVKFD